MLGSIWFPWATLRRARTVWHSHRGVVSCFCLLTSVSSSVPFFIPGNHFFIKSNLEIPKLPCGLCCCSQHSQNATEGACQERLSVQLSALQKSGIRAEILDYEPVESAICSLWQAHSRLRLLGLPFCLLPPSLLLGSSCCHFMAFQQSWLGILFSDVTYELVLGSRSTNFHRN